MASDEDKTRAQLLEEELVYLRHATSHAPVGLCYIDCELRFVRMNEWFARLHGPSVEEHLGQRIQDILPQVAAGVLPSLRQMIETGQPILQGTVQLESPAHPGERRFYEHDLYPRKSEDDAVIGVSCIVRDVTERKRGQVHRSPLGFGPRWISHGLQLAPIRHGWIRTPKAGRRLPYPSGVRYDIARVYFKT